MRRLFTLMALLLALTACSTNDTPAPSNTTTVPTPTTGTSGSTAPAYPAGDLSADILGRWNVTALNGAALAPNSSITMQFEPGGQLGAQACNSIGGSYTLNADALSFGQLRSTMMACDPPVLMNQETAFQQALASTASASIEGTTLRLFDAAGQEVVTFERLQ